MKCQERFFEIYKREPEGVAFCSYRVCPIGAHIDHQYGKITGLAIDKDDNIFVANYSANNIIKLTPEGTPSIYADVKKPYCLIYDKAHNRLYVTEQGTNKLLKFDL